MAGCLRNVRQRTSQSSFLRKSHLGILSFQFIKNFLRNIRNRFLRTPGIHPTPLHIKVYHIISIQMFPVILCSAYLQTLKQLFRIAAAAIIGGQHIGGNRFTKTSGAAVADTVLFRVHDAVHIADQTCFIHIYF